MDKQCFHGVFNWAGESYSFWCHATDQDRAFTIMIGKLAKKLVLTWYAVAVRYISGQTDNYFIERR